MKTNNYIDCTEILHIPTPELQRIAVMSASQASAFVSHISAFIAQAPIPRMLLAIQY